MRRGEGGDIKLQKFILSEAGSTEVSTVMIIQSTAAQAVVRGLHLTGFVKMWL